MGTAGECRLRPRTPHYPHVEIGTLPLPAFLFAIFLDHFTRRAALCNLFRFLSLQQTSSHLPAFTLYYTLARTGDSGPGFVRLHRKGTLKISCFVVPLFSLF